VGWKKGDTKSAIIPKRNRREREQIGQKGQGFKWKKDAGQKKKWERLNHGVE